MTRDEAAAYLNVHPGTLYRWATDGMIAYSWLGDGARAPLRFTKVDLDDFMRTHRIAAVEDTAARLSHLATLLRATDWFMRGPSEKVRTGAS